MNRPKLFRLIASIAVLTLVLSCIICVAGNSGAAPLAAVLAAPGRFSGRKVAIVCSGGNISPAQLAALIQ